MANPQNLQPPFKKDDPRINRKGRPRNFDALRALAKQIASEELQGADGEAITRIEALLRVMSSSKNNADRALFLAYAYGRPRDELDITSAGKQILVNFDYSKLMSRITTGSESDTDAPS